MNKKHHDYIDDEEEELSGGAKANKNGSRLERFVAEDLVNAGFSIMTYKQYCRRVDSTLPDYFVVKEVPFTNIYGLPGKTEFVIHTPEETIRVECKSQDTPGSVREKIPFAVLNAIQRFPEEKVLIILEGEEMPKEITKWARKATQPKSKGGLGNGEIKNISIFGLYGWRCWLDKLMKISIE